MIIYGMNPVLDSIDLYFDKIKKIYLSKKTFNKFNKNQLKKINNLPIIYISEGDFKNLTQSNNHQSIAAEIKIDSVNMLDDLKKNIASLGSVLILDHVQDPQNIGAISRTCVFFGISNIILPNNRTASISPGSVKSSAGAIFSINFYQVPNLVNTIKILKENDYWIIGADLKGEDYQDSKFDKFIGDNVVFVIGSESKGLSSLIRSNCDILLRINGNGSTDSLNVNVAAGILFSRFSD
jgi:23S rRNA (guanosine2251-2'-O)-methyltransferase|tara:strand:+ start:1903 stop:2616 length:714 start_codon:yes stop_codon:yes gene_type:complete